MGQSASRLGFRVARLASPEKSGEALRESVHALPRKQGDAKRGRCRGPRRYVTQDEEEVSFAAGY